jgi:hypothetical protein
MLLNVRGSIPANHPTGTACPLATRRQGVCMCPPTISFFSFLFSSEQPCTDCYVGAWNQIWKAHLGYAGLCRRGSHRCSEVADLVSRRRSHVLRPGLKRSRKCRYGKGMRRDGERHPRHPTAVLSPGTNGRCLLGSLLASARNRPLAKTANCQPTLGSDQKAPGCVYVKVYWYMSVVKPTCQPVNLPCQQFRQDQEGWGTRGPRDPSNLGVLLAKRAGTRSSEKGSPRRARGTSRTHRWGGPGRQNVAGGRGRLRWHEGAEWWRPCRRAY